MEASGVCTEPVYHALCEQDFEQVVVVNPAHAKALKGHKTDARDCARLAELFECGLLRGWQDGARSFWGYAGQGARTASAPCCTPEGTLGRIRSLPPACGGHLA